MIIMIYLGWFLKYGEKWLHGYQQFNPAVRSVTTGTKFDQDIGKHISCGELFIIVIP